MIWAVRAGFTLGIVTLLALALLTYQSQPSAAPIESTPAPVAVAPTAPPTPRPTSTPQTVISRVALTTPTPAPRPNRTGPGPLDVSIDDDGFAPAILRIQVGQRVVWRNDSQLSHDVTPTSGGVWGSGPILPTASVAQVFNAPGQYDYICSLHSAMRGRIIVTP